MNLKQKLEYHYKAFDKSQISPDPLEFLHLFNDRKEIELMGFVASVFAYGNVKQIQNTLNKFVNISDNKPVDFVLSFDGKRDRLKNLRHRFYTADDIASFFLALKKSYIENSLLKDLFLKFYNPAEQNLKSAVAGFSNYFLSTIKKNNRRENTNGVKFMFPLPELGSACKRMNLFLRWMIRKDDLDFGIWNEIPPRKLIIPVDTHVARICRMLGLTNKKNPSWKMAEEITENLRKYDPEDPVKYDFAICHIGMRKLEF